MGTSGFGTSYQLGLYWEHSAATTKTVRKACAHQRAAERVGEQGYQEIVSIAVAVMNLVGISRLVPIS